MNEIPVQSWGLWQPATARAAPASPTPDEHWELPQSPNMGWANVFYGAGNTTLQRPVILADGFHYGPTNYDNLWEELNGRDFAFATELRARGYDVILLGFNSCSASILQNAEIARMCIMRAISARQGDSPLVVGGFSTGGLITRYALAKMERENIDHQTAVYLSYDSPHRGASISISLQALAHFLVRVAPAMSQQINSPAARQILWQHLESVDATPREDPMRTELLAALGAVGGWPMRPRKLAVANGRGDGKGNGVPPGVPALEVTSGNFRPTTLRTQTPNSLTVLAYLQDLAREKVVRVRGLPELDGAPGGMLNMFAIAAANLTMPEFGSAAVAHFPATCFVPTISAIAGRDITEENLKASVTVDMADVDDIKCSSENVLHSKMTAELGQWILERLPG